MQTTTDAISKNSKFLSGKGIQLRLIDGGTLESWDVCYSDTVCQCDSDDICGVSQHGGPSQARGMYGNPDVMGVPLKML